MQPSVQCSTICNSQDVEKLPKPLIDCFHSNLCWCSVTQSRLLLCDPVDYSTPGFPVFYHLPKLAQTHAQWVSDAIRPSHPLSSPSPPTLIFCSIKVFSNESVLCIRQPKYCSFSFNISPSSVYSGLICFGTDWSDILAVHGTLKSSLTPQFKSINSSVLSFLYGPNLTSIYDYWKNIALTIQTFVRKVMPLLFNILSRFVIAFLPKSKYLLISRLQSPFSVILEPKKRRSVCFHCFPMYFPWSDGTRCRDLNFLNAEF